MAGGVAAGTLIIWDRMFGTFQEEKDDERVVYGLTTPIRSFDPFWVQFHHLFHVLGRVWSEKGIVNKVRPLKETRWFGRGSGEVRARFERAG